MCYHLVGWRHTVRARRMGDMAICLRVAIPTTPAWEASTMAIMCAQQVNIRMIQSHQMLSDLITNWHNYIHPVRLCQSNCQLVGINIARPVSTTTWKHFYMSSDDRSRKYCVYNVNCYEETCWYSQIARSAQSWHLSRHLIQPVKYLPKATFFVLIELVEWSKQQAIWWQRDGC